MAYNRLIGNLGESIACEWLSKHGYLILGRNYLKKWGEIDIIATKDKIIHFIEVKSITSYRGDLKEGYRPEENVHEIKQKRLRKTIQTYWAEKKLGVSAEFKFHIITVDLNQNTRKARVTFMENIIL